MNCTKCGKEIPEGEETLCEECKKKENGESKNKSIVLIVIIIAVILVLGIVGYFLFGRNSKIGNTIGNIRNYGYSAIQGNWIYYIAPSEDGSKIGIYKVKTNGSDKKEIFMDSMDILSLNISGNYIYFIGVGMESKSEEDEIDNKIYKMKLDGSGLEVINDNEFNNNCYEIYLIDNSIYYIGVDANIYKMNLDGTEKTIVSENGTGYLGITKDYIIYNFVEENASDYFTYIMNIDGTNARPIIEGKRMYSVNVKDNYIYYTDEDKKIYRTKIDSGEEELILDTTAYNLNLKDNYLYYLNYADFENEDLTVCIYRVKTDGSSEQPEKIKSLETYSSFIDVVGNWVMYLDSNDSEVYINMVKVDGSKEQQLYLLKPEEQQPVIEDQEATNENTSEGTEETQDGTTTEPTDNTTDVQNQTQDATNSAVEENTSVDTNSAVTNEVAPENTAN